MRYKKPKAIITPATIAMASMRASDAIDEMYNKANRAYRDSEREHRKQASMCPYCWYIRRSYMSTHPCGMRECGLCAGHIVESRVLCDACAKQYALCVWCGGDMQMDDRRSRNLPPENHGRQANK